MLRLWLIEFYSISCYIHIPDFMKTASMGRFHSICGFYLFTQALKSTEKLFCMCIFEWPQPFKANSSRLLAKAGVFFAVFDKVKKKVHMAFAYALSEIVNKRCALFLSPMTSSCRRESADIRLPEGRTAASSACRSSGSRRT